MANPRLIKKRVGSIKNIGKITKALEMVSASKVQKAQTTALSAKPYARTIYELVSSLAGERDVSRLPLMKASGEVGSTLYILVSTNRGLAGSLNTNLFRFAEEYLRRNAGISHFFVTVGKKGRSFAANFGKLLADLSDERSVESVVSTLTRLVIDGFTDGAYDEVYVIYSEFINALNQEPRVKKLLPITKAALTEEFQKEAFGLMGESEERKVSETPDVAYSYEPDPVTVLGQLLPFYLEIQLAESIYEADASEHSARMIAMKNATDNASELSEGLTLLYNKARQSLITTEISDITTAQASLADQNG